MAGAESSDGVCIDFVIGDWSLSGGNYIIDLSHNLGIENVSTTIFEGVNRISVDLETKIDSNKYRLRVPQIPDLRFAGKACFIGIAP